MTNTQLIAWTLFTVIVNAAVTVLLLFRLRNFMAKPLAEHVWSVIEPLMDKWWKENGIDISDSVEVIDSGEVKP
jgi:hypothetical protein